VKVAFYKSTRPGLKGLYNRFVRWWDCGPDSHCELVFSDGISASSSFEDGGVRFKIIEYDPAKWDFVEVPWADEARARAWFVARVGKAYDLMGNAHFVAPPIPDSKDKWFCSEAIAEALGLLDAWRLGPNGLKAMLISFGEIWKRRV
jgi:hypothetical protein